MGLKMWRNRAGFSLLEIIIVITCLLILLAMAVPNWLRGTWPTSHLKGTAQQVIADIRHAKIRSITTNRPFRIIVSPQTNSYRIQRKGSMTGVKGWEDILGSHYAGVSRPGILPKGVYIGSVSRSTILIKPTGNISATTIILENSKGEKIEITCSMSGRIRMGRRT